MNREQTAASIARFAGAAAPIRLARIPATAPGSGFDRNTSTGPADGSISRFERDRCVFCEGEVASSYFKVVSGAVRLFKTLVDGRRQIVGFALPGDFFGLALQSDYSFSAEAVDDAVVLRFARPRIETMAADFVRRGCSLVDLLTSELMAAQDQMLLLGRKTAIERVATFLVMMAERARPAGGDDHAIELPMSRQDIADYLGLTLETVSRSINQLKRSGLIALPHPNRVVIRRSPALRNLGQGEEGSVVERHPSSSSPWQHH